MDLRTLKYFVTIVEQGSITNASKKLNIAQPALSIELKKLEGELGVSLFKRENKSMTITNEGKLLYSKSLNLLSMANNIYNDINGFKNKKILRLGIMSSSYGIYLTESLNEYVKENPNVSFDISEGSTYELLDMINDNIIELAFVRSPFINKNVTTIELLSEPMVAIGKASLFNTTNEYVTIEELERVPLIYYKRYDNLFTSVFTKKNLNMNILCKNEDARTTIIWANQGLGIGIIPYSAIKLVDKSLEIRVIKENEFITTPMIVYKSNIDLSDEALEFINKYKKNYTL